MQYRTDTEVHAEIEALRKLLSLIPENNLGIKTALKVLENWMSIDDVFNAYEDGELFDHAYAALSWRDGLPGFEAPSILWRKML